jgi:hypothetical protein
VQRTHRARVQSVRPRSELGKGRSLVGVELAEAPYFRAVLAPFGAIGEDACTLSDDTAAHLGVHEGDDVWLLPLE